MQADAEPSAFHLLMNCGDASIRPSLGLGVLDSDRKIRTCEGFVAMSPGGYPDRTTNWRSACAGRTRGASIRDTQIDKLVENVRNAQSRRLHSQLELRRTGTQAPARTRPKPQIDARFVLRTRISHAARNYDTFDVSREPESILKMYGEGTQARQILIARRLIERRPFVVWHSAGADP